MAPEIPVFVMHELLIRLSAFDPHVGGYVSHELNSKGAVVKTTARLFQFPRQLLEKQFADPRLITDEEIVGLLAMPGKIKNSST